MVVLVQNWRGFIIMKRQGDNIKRDGMNEILGYGVSIGCMA